MYKIEYHVLFSTSLYLYLPEMGGILGMDINNVITEFYFDNTGINLKHQYIPDVDRLNEIIYE